MKFIYRDFWMFLAGFNFVGILLNASKGNALMTALSVANLAMDLYFAGTSKET